MTVLAPARPSPAPVVSTVLVADFWRDAGPSQWFAKDPGFDRTFRDRFLSLHEAAARGDLSHAMAAPDDALGLILLLDQFPRNAFRGSPRMYSTDATARALAADMLDAGHDRAVAPELALFFYLPFGHSELLADQEHSVTLTRRLGQPHLTHAIGHRAIVRRFARFPHRNPILGRITTPDEQRFLDDGGFKG